MSTETTEPAAPPKSRERRHPCHYKYVRKANGHKYELRLYLGGGKRHGVQITLGLFDDEWSAGRAFRKAVRLINGQSDPVSVWEAVRPLIADGTLPAGLLPKYVKRLKGEPTTYVAQIRRGKVRASLGPYDDPAEAGRAALAFAELARAVGGQKSIKPPDPAPTTSTPAADRGR